MREQRRARRFALNVEIQEIIIKSVQGARLLNLSSNGAKVELPFSARINEQVAFWVILPGFKKPSKFIGRVAWKKPVNPEGRYVTGLQYYQNYWEIDQWLRQQTLKVA
jgi:PilZ domain